MIFKRREKMKRIYYSRDAGSALQQLLAVAIDGDTTRLDELVKSTGEHPKSVAVFYILADEHIGKRFYLLYEVVKSGNFDMFTKLVEGHGLSVYILEEEYARRKKGYDDFKRHSEKENSHGSFDDASEYMATRCAYSTTSLVAYADKCHEDLWQKCRAIGKKWRECNRQARSLETADIFDEKSIEEYECVHKAWMYQILDLVFASSPEKDRRHQRSRPPINPRYENELERRRLLVWQESFRRDCAKYLKVLNGVKNIIEYLASSKFPPQK